MSRLALLTLALALALSPATVAAPTPKDVKAKSTLDRVKPVGIGGLIEQPTARESLKLTKDQEEKIAAARKEVGASLTAIAKAQQNNAGAAAGRLDAVQEMVDKMSDAVLAYDAKVIEVLSDEQARRLKQLHLQREGPVGLVSRYAVRELGLTPEQEDKLADTVLPLHKPKIFDMLSTAIVQPGMPDVDKLVAARAAKIDGMRDEALKHLTAEQKKRWKEMLGEEVPTAELVRGSAEAFVYKLSMEFAK